MASSSASIVWPGAGARLAGEARHLGREAVDERTGRAFGDAPSRSPAAGARRCAKSPRQSLASAAVWTVERLVAGAQRRALSSLRPTSTTVVLRPASSRSQTRPGRARLFTIGSVAPKLVAAHLPSRRRRARDRRCSRRCPTSAASSRQAVFSSTPKRRAGAPATRPRRAARPRRHGAHRAERCGAAPSAGASARRSARPPVATIAAGVAATDRRARAHGPGRARARAVALRSRPRSDARRRADAARRRRAPRSRPLPAPSAGPDAAATRRSAPPTGASRRRGRTPTSAASARPGGDDEADAGAAAEARAVRDRGGPSGRTPRGRPSRSSRLSMLCRPCA